ncbi:right-handed parallel beta-helix repeat-containing protein [Bacillus thermocopriae]|uniref:Right-handed parallel beta-helix repeat-containing protein n=1 Tax=Neobacillus thermocopriae TaxID=1215031 RepID=A0A6B3TV49_9BACI|nr:right-handed parallel beta-helix repeat-containing protein [Neobacillus thermocopriae]NEX80246.1 right-handed parallel beta-helix repeat-containing protein [Neobacillus thermocopriae]
MRRKFLTIKEKINYIILSILIVVLVLISIKSFFTNSPEVVKEPKIQKTSPQKETLVHTPEQFGANGFDNEPDTEAIQKAINSGNTVILKSGATYIIDETLKSSHSINIKTDHSEKAKIVQKKNKSALIVDNQPVVETYVTKQILTNQSFVVLANTKGIKPGYLLHLKSSKLWYWDDRGYLKKGELHKVIKVEGKKVYLDRPIVENYKVGKEERVSASIYPNISLQLENITFTHPKPLKTIMLKINYTMNTNIENVIVKNSKRIGILLDTTYQTFVKKVFIDLGTTKDISSGYGIQDYGGTETLITDSVFKRIRRGVDFSGGTPSRYGIVRNSRAYGNKKGELASGNSGFGTHSTAEYITFENNYVENFNYGFLVRGRNITVKENILKGYSISFIAITYGNNVKVLKNTYHSINNSSLEMFILFLKTYKGTIDVQGNVVNSLKGPFIKGDIGQLESLILRKNTIQSK